ncbi:MAG: hypothetical protein K1X47_02520 [Cyclobacteriaceae bacterium]|nr:hypothetical protein [Cyclobacteriaceae bacterium]
MRSLIPMIALVLLAACSSGKKSDEQAFLESQDTARDNGPTIPEEVIGSILQQIPSPLEISAMLKESGSRYEPGLLNSPDNLPKYNSNYKKALNLGVFGTDLGYTNIYQKSKDGIQYLSSIKSLANDLNIGQFFDIETIGRLAANSKNLDSLLLITTQNFNNINGYLQNQRREHLSVLLLTGGWVEAMNVVSQAALATPSNKELQEKVGEQKIIIEKLILLLGFYKDDANMAGLLKDMQSLMAAYEKINIVYTYKESTVEVVNGVAVIKDNSSTTIQITKEDVKSISALVGAMRDRIIG